MRKDKILTEALKAKRLAKTSLKESLNKSLKESSSNVEALVHNIIKQFEGMNPEYFYVALMIYDVLGISNPSEALIKEVKKYLDDLDTIYDTYVRDELSILANELNSSLHSSEKHDDIVEEKLGEYRKGSKLSKNIEKEFKY